MIVHDRIVLSSDHSAIELRQLIANHIKAHGWAVVDIGPTSRDSTDYPEKGRAAAQLVAAVRQVAVIEQAEANQAA